MVLNLLGQNALHLTDWNHIMIGAATGVCCLAVAGALYFSQQHRNRSPLSRYIRRMAMWGLLIATMATLFSLEGAMPGNVIVDVLMWIVLLPLGVTTAWLIASMQWVEMTQDRRYWESAATELRESKHRFDMARRATAGGWWEWRIPENHLWCDPQFRELLNGSDTYSEDDTSSRWERILHPDDVAHVYHELTQHLERSSEISIDCRVRVAPEAYRWCRIKAVSIQQPDCASFVLAGSIQDIDDYRRTEEHLRQLSQYISQKHKLESLGEATGSVAHEFKNVLQAISGQLQFAERHIPEESEARSELAMATNLIEQANEISDELLHFTGRPNERAKLVHPNSVLKTLEIILCPMLPQCITLSIDPLQHPARVAALPTALQQALLNLCLNAKDAMPGGGTLEVSARLVRRRNRQLSAGAGPPLRFVRFSVSDTGGGVPAEIRERIFEPFYTTKPAGCGTGLGLAIVADIAKKHGGWVALKGGGDHGSTFSLLIPVATRGRELSAADQSLPANAPPIRFTSSFS